jgi:hypothetical protein
MRSDGRVLPDLTQTLALHQLGLIRSDELPDLAARWLAAGMTDTESTRMLAGHPRQDPWGLDQLLGAAADEASTAAPTDPAAIEDIAVSWVASRWLDDQDTRAAIRTLARLGETNPDLNLGRFIGLDDEWSGRWGRLPPALKAEADKNLADILNRPDDPSQP